MKQDESCLVGHEPQCDRPKSECLEVKEMLNRYHTTMRKIAHGKEVNALKIRELAFSLLMDEKEREKNRGT